MVIVLNTETEALVQKRLQSGRFLDVEDVIVQALRSQDFEAEQERTAIGDRLEQAIREFDEGGGVPASQVPQRLRELKAAFGDR